jgi:hypothetical protein
MPGNAETLLDRDAGWPTGQGLHLNRTPPLYEGDPLDDGTRPRAAVTLALTSDALVVRLRWSDGTRTAPSDPRRYVDGGEEHIYPKHSSNLERFADAACVMVPKEPAMDGRNPSLMMGEAERPVDLYYWQADRGFQRLVAAGRGSTTDTGESLRGDARHTEDGWEVLLTLPPSAAERPVAFALWDGGQGHRAGIKYFTPWYEVSTK